MAVGTCLWVLGPILIRSLSPDDLTLRRRPPKAWNESDLDVAYEKKSSQTASYEREWVTP